MTIVFHKDFKKQFQKLPIDERDRFKQRLRIFREDLYDAVLYNHPLHGKYAGCRSINVAGDLRAIYKFVKKETVVFIAIGTHGNLYS